MNADFIEPIGWPKTRVVTAERLERLESEKAALRAALKAARAGLARFNELDWALWEDHEQMDSIAIAVHDALSQIDTLLPAQGHEGG